jgi:hypothetical protein
MLRWSTSGRRIASSNEPHPHHHHHHLAGDWNWIGRDHHQHRHRRHDHPSQLRSPPSLHSMPPSRAQRGTAPSMGNDGHCYPDHVQVELVPLPLCHQTPTPPPCRKPGSTVTSPDKRKNCVRSREKKFSKADSWRFSKRTSRCF